MKKISELANEDLKNIANLLITDTKGISSSNALDGSKLDFSIESLKEVDKYLEKVRKERKNLTAEEINKIILRTGAYLGEVIKKNRKRRFIWKSYEEALKIRDSTIATYGKSILTWHVIYDVKRKGLLYVLGKPYKFLEYGKGDSLWAFAKVALEEI